MLTIENGFVTGFDLYSHRDNLKFYKCIWDTDAKKWRAPDNTSKLQFYLDKVNDAEKEQINKLWNDAIDNCGFDKFKVKKGTSEYEQTRTEFKNLLQISKQKMVENK